MIVSILPGIIGSKIFIFQEYEMNLLITGAFGNVGISVLDEALSRGHNVTVLELPSPKNRKVYKRYGKKLKSMVWGDLTNKEYIVKALEGVETVIHLAAVIPPLSERNKNLCDDINIGGTVNILEEAEKSGGKISMVFASSSSVMGDTQSTIPPVKVDHIPNPFGNYAKSKLEAEEKVLKSGIPVCITRFGGVLTTRSRYSMSMLLHGFEFPFRSRYEVVLDIDLAAAVLNGAEQISAGSELDKKIFFIGGGAEKGCQIYHNQMYSTLFGSIGLTVPGEKAFANHKPCMVDWLDTEESQRLLNFQHHHFDDYLKMFRNKMKLYKPFLFLFGKIISSVLEKKSPYPVKEER